MRRVRKLAMVLSTALGCTATLGAQAVVDFTVRPPALFTMTPVASFKLPWRIAFLPDGRMLVTEKVGAVWVVSSDGTRIPVANIPQSVFGGWVGGYYDNGGMLGVYVSPTYASDQNIFLTYSENGAPFGTGIALARARLVLDNGNAKLDSVRVIWHEQGHGYGGQLGGAVAFSPDGKFLFLALGDRNRITPPQDPDQPLGKILRLTLDGKPAPGNPNAGKVGSRTINIIATQNNLSQALNNAPVFKYELPAQNLTPAETWTNGHRNPLGLMFTPDGRFWEIEHGPLGGDELNLIEPGANYGWPLVSEGEHYDHEKIPSPSTRPDLKRAVMQWNPVIAPGNIVYYRGTQFPEWNNSALIAGLKSKSLVRIKFDGKGGASFADSYYVGRELRDVAVAPDGSVWVLVNEMEGGLFRLIPKK